MNERLIMGYLQLRNSSANQSQLATQRLIGIVSWAGPVAGSDLVDLVTELLND